MFMASLYTCVYHVVSVTCDNVPNFLQILASRLYLCDVTGVLHSASFYFPVACAVRGCDMCKCITYCAEYG